MCFGSSNNELYQLTVLSFTVLRALKTLSLQPSINIKLLSTEILKSTEILISLRTFPDIMSTTESGS